ncbi:unnamed protein product [Linum tenue]|nr:unnamed protein product [Linum tenue]
MLPRSIR